MPVLITRCSNNYGPYQFPEKLIPLFVTNLMEGKKVPLYGDGMNVRDWLYVEDHCDAIWTVLNKGTPGEVYNIGGNNEMTNRDITETIIREMGKNWDDSSTTSKTAPATTGDTRSTPARSSANSAGSRSTASRSDPDDDPVVQDHQDWWRAIKSGEYLKYYETQYATR